MSLIILLLIGSVYSQNYTLREYVFDIMNDELFWKNLTSQKTIHDHVAKEIDFLVSSKLHDLVRLQIPDHLYTFLNHHDYLVVMKDQINQIASEYLSKLADDNKYHLVTNAHLSSINKKYNTQMKELERQLANTQIIADRIMNYTRQTIKRELDKIKETNTMTDNLYYQINIMRSYIMSLYVLCAGLFLYACRRGS